MTKGARKTSLSRQKKDAGQYAKRLEKRKEKEVQLEDKLHRQLEENPAMMGTEEVKAQELIRLKNQVKELKDEVARLTQASAKREDELLQMIRLKDQEKQELTMKFIDERALLQKERLFLLEAVLKSDEDFGQKVKAPVYIRAEKKFNEFKGKFPGLDHRVFSDMVAQMDEMTQFELNNVEDYCRDELFWKFLLEFKYV